MQRFRCECGQPLFFNNHSCERCGRNVGFEPVTKRMITLPLAQGDSRTEDSGGGEKLGYRLCANAIEHQVCNWLVPQGAPETLCIACSLTRTIPDLSQPSNLERWTRLEAAKRRLLYSLLWLGLPIVPRRQDSKSGLAFDFLEDRRSNPSLAVEHVATGHANGVITINVLEADPVERVRARERMNEQYRTLLGHIRHESGHFYWDRLIRDTDLLTPFRNQFGDERDDYAQALNRHYQNGPAADWAQGFISSYASCHPWEDWAETWAHYLHMVDTLDTAKDFGLVDKDEAPTEGQDTFGGAMAAWREISVMLNELNRSMGQEDSYPFVVPDAVAAKLHFIHNAIHDAAAKSGI